MKCKMSEKILALYVGGELSQSKEREVAEHIKECPACAKKAEELRRSRVILKENSTIPELGADFWQSLKRDTIARIRGNAQQNKYFGIPFIYRNRFAAALLSIIVIIVSAVIIYNQLFRTSPQPVMENISQAQTFVENKEEELISTPQNDVKRDERLVTNKVEKEDIAQSIHTKEKRETTQPVQAPSIIEQKQEEKPMVMTFYYEEPKIKVIWIYNTKLSDTSK
jgi:glutaredoxin-related protein